MSKAHWATRLRLSMTVIFPSRASSGVPRTVSSGETTGKLRRTGARYRAAAAAGGAGAGFSLAVYAAACAGFFQSV